MVLDWYLITMGALLDLWQGFLVFMPKLIGALVVFLIGWFVSAGIGKLVEEILRRLKLNQLFERELWKEALERAEFKVDASSFIGAIVKLILMIVFLLVAVEILGLTAFAGFLTTVLGYLPNVIVAVLIFVVAVVIADIVEKIVRAAVESSKVGYGKLAGSIVKWSIWTLAIFAILRQLLIATELVDVLFRGLVYGAVALFVIAFGLAFGLGGRDLASEVLQGLKRKFTR